MYAQASTYDENPFSNSSDSQRVPLTRTEKSAPPAWLAEPVTQANASVGGDGVLPGAGEIDAAVPRMILYSRVINLLLSICMIVASLLCKCFVFSISPCPFQHKVRYSHSSSPSLQCLCSTTDDRQCHNGRVGMLCRRVLMSHLLL